MEGRVTPVAADANDDDPPLSPPRSPQPPPLALTPPPSSTYIVQIPRDQIYRIPPPQNAKIVESYRNPEQQPKKCGGKRTLWILVTLVVLVAIASIIVGVTRALFSPKAPEFSVTKVLVVDHTPQGHSHNKHANHHPAYEISLKAYNPNERMSVSYGDGGVTSLSFEQKKIGGGKFSSSLSQDAKDSETFHLTLAGSDGALPTMVEKSMKDTTTKIPVSLSMAIYVPIKIKGSVSWNKDMKVTCDFKVSTLASGTHVTSQNCKTKF